MAHFARVINDMVVEVIVAEQEFINTLPDADMWVQTSYNTHGGKHYDPETREPDGTPGLRKNYAGIGFKYDKELDAFIPPQPFGSWVLDKETCLWKAPLPMPDDADTRQYLWNEYRQRWVFTGYQLNEKGEWVKVHESGK